MVRTRVEKPTPLRDDVSCDVELVHPGRVARVRDTMPGPERVDRLAEVFHACSDPTRLRILLALATEELCVCDVAATVAASASGVSHHLRLLRALRLVRSRREGRMVFYRLDDDHVRDLLAVAQAHLDH
jgi:DNA-binding transcriptional ArsR family regulator